MNFRIAMLLLVFPVSTVHGQNFFQRLRAAVQAFTSILLDPNAGFAGTFACNQGTNIVANQVPALAEFGITAEDISCDACGTGALTGTDVSCRVNTEICFIDTPDLRICGSVSIKAQCGGVGGPDGCETEVCFIQADGSNYEDVCVTLETNGLTDIVRDQTIQLNGCSIYTKDADVEDAVAKTTCETCDTESCDGGFIFSCNNLDLTKDDEVVEIPAQTECQQLLQVEIGNGLGQSMSLPMVAAP